MVFRMSETAINILRQLYRLWRIDYVFYSESLKGQNYFSPDVSYSDHNMVVWRGCVKN